MPPWGWVCIWSTRPGHRSVADISITEGKRRKQTLENGTHTHGWLVQANNALFEEGNINNPAPIEISPDPGPTTMRSS